MLIVGFQAPHTLGRRIVEKRQRVKIFGVERELRAEVVVMNGFSAHADQKDLRRVRRGARARAASLKNIILVHGEPGPQKALTSLLEAAGPGKVTSPAAGDVLEV